MPEINHVNTALRRERYHLLRRIDALLEIPMIILGAAWLLLLVIEFVWGLTPMLEGLGTFIWGVFILDFLGRLFLAPDRVTYLSKNWLTMLALLLPALRVFRLARVFRLIRTARAARGLRLLRLLTSSNRGMRAFGSAMRRRGFGYVAGLTFMVTIAGAAGMHVFEKEVGLATYSEALWWTAMIMTTMGSSYWPQSPEGRILCFLLSIYAFTVFGYVTATLASYFIGRDAQARTGEVAGSRELRAIESEIKALRRELASADFRGGGDTN